MDAILKASYGDKAQREENNRGYPARAVSARVQRDFKERRAAQPPQEIPTPPASYGPAFWEPKHQGQAFGGHGNRAPKMGKVEIRPGVIHHVELPDKQRQGRAVAINPEDGRPTGARAGRPSSAPPGRRPGGPAMAPKKAYEMDTLELAPALAQLEAQMREQLKRHSAMHIKERTVLLQALGKVVRKRDVDILIQDKVTPAQFAAAWSALGVPMSAGYVYAIFNKYGQDKHGNMPMLNFVDTLLYGAPRQLMLENDWVQKGAYKASQRATHTGKIQYRECKKGVWPPSNWDPRTAERSATLPDVRLQLQFVHGYDGIKSTSPNLFYTITGEAVYFVAAVGIVYNRATHTQRFFLGHDDDILSLALHPERSLVATGQVGKEPVVIIWDSLNCKAVQTLKHEYGDRGMQCLCFSPDGSLLASVATDNGHTMYIWDWRRRQVLMEGRTNPGVPPATYGVVWSPFHTNRLVTYGQNYIKFWDLTQNPSNRGPPLQCNYASGVFSGVKTHTPLSACFLPSGVVLTGKQNGAICSWKGARLLRATPAHALGVLQRRPDGTQMYGGVRCLVLQNQNVLLSGGADGYVIKWDVSQGDLGPALLRIPLLRPDQMGKVNPPALRALDCFPGSEVFLAGTASCDVWEVDDTPEVLVYGQQGDCNGLAMNPAYPHVFATISEADSVIVFSADTRKPIRVVALAQNGDMACSGAFTPDGQHLAVGMWSGGIKVMEFHPAVAQVYWLKDSNESIDELKYSPDGRYLAAGSHDQHIYIYDVHNGYKKVAKCVGHSSTITHMDWSADGSILQSNDQAYELLYFSRNGRQVKENMRDTQWASWTCTLGFDVMGIWPPYSDGTDVNACDRSPSNKYLLTADDFGKVKLFNYPVVVEHAPAYAYGGHCSFVANVRWAADESFAVSVGGHDRAVFQWSVARNEQPPVEQNYQFMPVGNGKVVWAEPAGKRPAAAAAAAAAAASPVIPAGVDAATPPQPRGGAAALNALAAAVGTQCPSPSPAKPRAFPRQPMIARVPKR